MQELDRVFTSLKGIRLSDTLSKPLNKRGHVQKCLLCNSRNCKQVDTISANKIISDWQNTFGINISAELSDQIKIPRYRCSKCGLEFFPSELAGSEDLYSTLQEIPWYYMPDKWEHDEAIQDIPIGSEVLEVGCGQGDFTQRLIREKDCKVIGIELNSSAVAIARSRGLPVQEIALENLVAEQRNTFDIVCHFQVLEHVSDPDKFLSNSVALLKPGGRLLFGVPNNDSFIRLDKYNLLNQPPHHVSRWTKQVLHNLVRYHNLQLLKIKYEPLASYHIDWFVRLQLRRIPRTPIELPSILSMIYKLIHPALNRTQWHRLFRGHTIYVAYCKEKSEN